MSEQEIVHGAKEVAPGASGCPIVAIGASAGGIQALNKFFEAMPKKPGVAFVVVLHLSKSHESHLVSVLERATNLDVVQVEKPRRIRPNCIYVISPNTVLTIGDDRLQARQPESEAERRHPVDAIFESLADYRGYKSICIVMSGSGSNGSGGAQRIRQTDGVVLVQDPDTAEHPEMPRNVILAGLADRILPVEEMPGVILDYVENAYDQLDRSEDDLATAGEAELNAILAVLRTRGRHDFSPYKQKTLVRRITRRMGLSQMKSMRQYAEKVRADPAELQALLGDLLINVTSFFRDPEAWGALDEKVIAPIVRSRAEGQSVRVWVPACSSGEEAYSIAMLLLERAEDAEKTLDIKVFATDAAPEALARARAGLFPETIAQAIPEARLNRFFDKEGEIYRAKPALREAVIFAPQNLLADPPFSRLDLVSCRNLLIYVEAEYQEKIIALLHFSLREGGYLFLGTAETVGKHMELFQPVSKKWRIYKRSGSTRHELVDFPIVGGARRDVAHLGHNDASRLRAPGDEARDALVETFAPPSVLIDEHSRALYFHGDLDPYLKAPHGEPTLDLISIARDELRTKLRAAIRQAAKEKAAVSADAGMKSPAGERVTLTVSPVTQRKLGMRFLVSFERHAGATGEKREIADIDHSSLSEGQLEEELRAAREELRFSVAQLETSNEELKASNEEITSMNEELQSTNEELETSKEELQSLNEELNTVNTQLQGKVEELEDRTNDLHNLLKSTAIATLFLDAKLCIRWFSPQIRDMFQIRQGDIGRPIADFAQGFQDKAFMPDAADVLQNLLPKEGEVAGGDGSWLLRRIQPYRTEDNRIDGVVATFTDITERKHSEEAVAAAKNYAERIVDTTRQPLVVLNGHYVVQSANRAFHEQFQLTAPQTEGRVLYEIGGGDWDIPELRRALRDTMPADGVLNDVELHHTFRELGTRHLLVNARRLPEDSLLLLAIEDKTERRNAEYARDALFAELQHRVKNLLTKVAAIITLSQNGKGPVGAYAEDLKERITAVARTEDLIGGRAAGISLRELVDSETSGVNGGRSIAIEGPDISLRSAQAQTIGLALHELATNALKYGALSKPGGTLSVVWRVETKKTKSYLTIQWVEDGVPIDGQPKPGFGSRLIREILPHMLGGTTDLSFTDGGVRCELRIEMKDWQAQQSSAV